MKPTTVRLPGPGWFRSVASGLPPGRSCIDVDRVRDHGHLVRGMPRATMSWRRPSQMVNTCAACFSAWVSRRASCGSAGCLRWWCHGRRRRPPRRRAPRRPPARRACPTRSAGSALSTGECAWIRCGCTCRATSSRRCSSAFISANSAPRQGHPAVRVQRRAVEGPAVDLLTSGPDGGRVLGAGEVKGLPAQPALFAQQGWTACGKV
jgi:hypothetical protein